MNRASMLLAAAAAVALTAAGCGGSDSGSSGSDANPAVEQAVKYAQCMRKNGVTDFPDPDKDGRFTIAAGGPKKTSPQFIKAKQACKSQEPPGVEDNPAQRSKAQQEWLRYAQCMRRNGVPDFPDPQDGRLLVPRDKINVNSPQFKKALNACRNVSVGGSEHGNG
ncbi:hypothetical protein [Actinomadura opuntiae]|uniref:hypothetical protein n=1 Tax=Actinomadura sp. OS1-43 TaxID=604315 RepID=UPI00255B0D0E|nr:hypothetical protein [Actinomadura sp. OS1-43]MDL4812649.1 hypothetical protein [Actinomadura sp. OS1-43]